MMFLRKVLFRSFFDFLKEHEFDKVLEVGATNKYNTNQYGINCNELIRTNIIEAEGITKADACNLQFKDKEFDLVISIAVLEHIFDFQKAIKEMKRVSKKYLFIGVPFIGKRHTEIDYWRFTESGLWESVGWKRYFSFRTISLSKNFYLAHCTMFHRESEK